MDIREQFNLIAEEYDAKRKKFIPCFDDFYCNATNFIIDNYGQPQSLLDLGAGTGLLTYFWYRRCKDTRFTLVDIAEDMLDVARRRFDGDGRVNYVSVDYSQQLPQSRYEVIASALSIHHLDDNEKRRLFGNIHAKLPAGGLFVNYDQFCADDETIDKWYNDSWEQKLCDSGLTQRDLQLWKQRRLFDKECSVQTETDMLKECKFSSVESIFCDKKFAVILAIK